MGIGDINGGFLPPTKPAIAAMTNALTPASTELSPSPKSPGDIPSTEEGLANQSKLFDKIMESRPLAKLEEEQGTEPEEEPNGAEGGNEDGSKDKTASPDSSQATPTKSDENSTVKADKTEEKVNIKEEHHHRHRRQFLNVNDHELKRVEEILTEIYSDFYDAYDSRSPGAETMPLQCDVPLLIQEIKDQVLSGCVIVFTGVIAINQKPQDSEIWQNAEAFGAQCQVELDERVTHCVIGSVGTEKMRKASAMPGVHVVWLAWLQTSIAFWKREPEDPFKPHFPSGQSIVPPPEQRKDALDSKPSPTAAATQGVQGMHIDPEDIEKDAEDFKAAWDDAAQAELDELMNGDDDDDWSSSEDEDAKDDEGRPKRGASCSPSRWSRENTPSRSILSRGPSPGPPKHVRYADDENQPLEDVREPQPGDIPSFPPRKKQKVLMLDAPSEDDDIPEANKMVYKPRPGDGLTPSVGGGSEGSEAEPASSDTEGDDFAKLLQHSLEEDGDDDGDES